MTDLMECNDTKSKRELRALERHLDKLHFAEKNGVEYEKFKNAMQETAKNDKNMNDCLRNIYKNA